MEKGALVTTCHAWPGMFVTVNNCVHYHKISHKCVNSAGNWYGMVSICAPTILSFVIIIQHLSSNWWLAATETSGGVVTRYCTHELVRMAVQELYLDVLYVIPYLESVAGIFHGLILKNYCTVFNWFCWEFEISCSSAVKRLPAAVYCDFHSEKCFRAYRLLHIYAVYE